MFSWAYLKTQDSYTHTTHKHTGTSTHLQSYCGSSAGRRCPWLAHFQPLWIWFLQVFALPWIWLHFCLFVAAASHDHKISKFVSLPVWLTVSHCTGQDHSEAKYPAHLICKHMITTPLSASATRSKKMCKILHKLPKSPLGVWHMDIISCEHLSEQGSGLEDTHNMGSIYRASKQNLQERVQNNCKHNQNKGSALPY